MKCPLKCKYAEKEICNSFLSSFGKERIKVLGCNMRVDLGIEGNP